MPGRYWLIAVPGSKENPLKSKERLATAATNSSLCTSDFQVPILKVGTLDLLMTLSDELTKADQQVEGLVKKIYRAYYDVMKSKPSKGGEGKAEKKEEVKVPQLMVEVEGVRTVRRTPHDFVANFEWNSDRFPPNAPIRDITDEVLKESQRADDKLKEISTAFNEARTNYDALARKESGSLLVKPLAPLLKAEDMIDTAHLLTVLLVIPVKQEKTFLDGYELLEQKYKERLANMQHARDESALAGGILQLEEVGVEEVESVVEEEKREAETVEQAAKRCKDEEEEAERKAHEARMARLPKCDNVVPRSAHKLSEDKEFVLYSVLVFKKGIDNFKSICRQERYTVRSYKYDPEEEKTNKANKQRYDKKRHDKYKQLVQFTQIWYSQMFTSWLHLKSMRCFVEAVLRYGLPVDFQCYALQPKNGHDSKLRKVLENMYGHLCDKALTGGSGSDNANAQAPDSADDEFFPYVSIHFNLTDMA